jgi:hypothetical protein
MSELAKLFMSHAPSIKYVFKNGDVANFVNHRYFTADETQVKELQYEIEKKQHPAFYINPAESEVNPAEQDPMSRLRKMIIEQHYAELAKKTGPQNDLGTITQTKLTPTSTTDISAVTANGVQAKLAQLIPASSVK